ncbi:hypothetical protein GH714_034555 [Hevea brasiliensis]|uniref:Uncharacterized protein n=1 Tax=Hevea brasiliensis TaxID=3981 RepID=A0A6A6N997_HEVBR|nr:hypothetical protein GH714_034555 [Hevea brasiliensis]
MGVLPNLRGSRTATQEGLPLSDGLSSPPSSSFSVSVPKKKWSNFLPVFVVLVVIAEIAFLGRLDMAKNAALVEWADSLFFKSSPLHDSGLESEDFGQKLGDFQKNEGNLGLDSCEEWLEKEDAVVYKRDFDKDPILVIGAEKEWRTCAVGCSFGFDSSRKPDAAFGSPNQGGTVSVLRSMESSHYYSENNIAQARRRGYKIIMTTSLSSDVPVGYFSWAEYDIMAPMQPKTEKALAAAFISNCGARNFRLQALEGLEKAKIKIDLWWLPSEP